MASKHFSIELISTIYVLNVFVLHAQFIQDGRQNPLLYPSTSSVSGAIAMSSADLQPLHHPSGRPASSPLALLTSFAPQQPSTLYKLHIYKIMTKWLKKCNFATHEIIHIFNAHTSTFLILPMIYLNNLYNKLKCKLFS